MKDSVKLVPREIREANFPIARFISQEEIARYHEALNHYSDKARSSLGVGSNIWSILLLNQIGIRTATIQELISAFENGIDLRSRYSDAREICLKSESSFYSPNNYLAKNLAKQLKIKQFKVPLIVKGLGIQEDKESDYGLAFKVNDEVEVINAPDFSHKNDNRRFSRINPDYSIEFNDNGRMSFYTQVNGLSKILLDGEFGMLSNQSCLADYTPHCRIVVVTDEDRTKDFESYISQLNLERKRSIDEVEKRYADAMKILKGN